MRSHDRNLFVAAAIAVLGLLYVLSATVIPVANTAAKPVDIPKGSSLQSIADSLAENGVIRDRYIFLICARLAGKSTSLKSGLYRFPDHVSGLRVLTILAEGSHQAMIRLTIREGLTIKKIAVLLEESMGFSRDSVIALCKDRSFIDSLGLDVRQLEGYLLPDTYNIRYDATPGNVVERIAKAMLAQITDESRRRMDDMGFSLHQILTMASLVEGETRLAEERARVAGVYYNRLKRGMLLQADPTIQYIIPDGPRRLFYSDLAINSPYNTYMYRGLPPGPVNNPGIAAIRAALYPEKHGYYYFVADGAGGHTFSRNYSEHLRAVAHYRDIQRRTSETHTD